MGGKKDKWEAKSKLFLSKVTGKSFKIFGTSFTPEIKLYYKEKLLKLYSLF